jgi:hypothetical protein
MYMQYRGFLIHRRLERAVSNEKSLINFVAPDWNHKSLTKYYHTLRTFCSSLQRLVGGVMT